MILKIFATALAAIALFWILVETFSGAHKWSNFTPEKRLRLILAKFMGCIVQIAVFVICICYIMYC